MGDGSRRRHAIERYDVILGVYDGLPGYVSTLHNGRRSLFPDSGSRFTDTRSKQVHPGPPWAVNKRGMYDIPAVSPC